jgi:predicted secreted acid phosphatase
MMSSLRALRFLLPVVLLAGYGCATTGSADSPAANDNLDAVLWLQSSTEYAAAALGTYAAATATLETLVASAPEQGRRMAVVLDVDETVLDNSSYQAQLIANDARYERESWDQWIALGAAPAVPGVVDFISKSQSLGVHVAFITNRACRARPGSDAACPQKAETLANLRDVGIDTASTTLFLRGDIPSGACQDLLTPAEAADGVWSSDKTSRRACVALDHDIVMLFGDQLGDFTREESAVAGQDVARDYAERWGKSWFMLPNPTYGGWRPSASGEKRSRLRGIESQPDSAE